MELKIDKPIVFFDLETTSVDTEQARIVQIAVIKYFPDGKVEEKDYLINPEVEIPVETTEIHGISNEMVADKPTFKQMSKALRAYFEGCDIGGFNSNSYDVNVLNAELTRAGLQPIDWNPNLVDVYKLFVKLYPSTLSGIYKRFFDEDLEGAHSALEDSRATIKILNKILKDEDFTCTPQELDVYLQGETKRVDFAGKFYKTEEGIFWNFGKHKDVKIEDSLKDSGYIEWFLKGSFSEDSKNVIRNVKSSINT